MIDVVIDPDLKVGVNQQITFVGFRDVAGETVPDVGTSVRAWDAKTGATAPAIVVAVNAVAMLVYLAVAWQEFAEVETEVVF